MNKVEGDEGSRLPTSHATPSASLMRPSLPCRAGPEFARARAQPARFHRSHRSSAFSAPVRYPENAVPSSYFSGPIYGAPLFIACGGRNSTAAAMRESCNLHGDTDGTLRILAAHHRRLIVNFYTRKCRIRGFCQKWYRRCRKATRSPASLRRDPCFSEKAPPQSLRRRQFHSGSQSAFYAISRSPTGLPTSRNGQSCCS
jgi:hypothetical protein